MVTQMMIERAKEGDAFAFEQIYNETIKGAYYVARKFLGTDTAAEDVLQESYIKVYEKLGEYKNGNFQGWVDVIVANRCKDYLKKKNPLLFSEMESDDGVEFDAEDTSEEFRPDRKVDYDETKRLVKEIIDKLPADQKMSVVMFYYEQMSVKEIAAALECSENTIKSRLNYGRKTIKAEVENLEKKGTKLYCAPILPFIIWMFKEEAMACEVPAGLASGNVIAKLAVETRKAGAKANIASSTVAKAGMSVGAKIGIGAVAAIIVAGGISMAVFLNSNQKEEPDVIPTADYVETNDVEEEPDTAESEPEEINIDEIVQAFVNEYAKINTNEETAKIVFDGVAYAYFWQGERPLIVMRGYSNAHGQADDAYFYSIYRVDTITGDVIEYGLDSISINVCEPDDFFGYNENGLLVAASWFGEYYQEVLTDDVIEEHQIKESSYQSLEPSYEKAEFIELDVTPVYTEKTSEETASENEPYERERPEPETDNPYFYFHGVFYYLPLEISDFTTAEWTHVYTNDSAGLEAVFKADGSPIEMILKYDENKENIIRITLDTNNTDETNLFPMMLNGISWNTPVEQAKEILGEATHQTVDGLYQWYTFNKGNCYLTFGYRAGGLQIKYMEMGLIEE